MAADGRVVTADEVLSHEFDVTSFRPGYDQRDVDTLLDEVIATLRAYEQGGRLARMTTADDVLSAQFRSTQLRAGYETSAVDDFFDTVVAALRHYEGGAASGAQAPVSERAPVVADNAPANTEWPHQGKGWWRRTR